jgi:hypothetical protein
MQATSRRGSLATAVAGLLLAASPSSVVSWAAISHYAFACDELPLGEPGDTLADCIESNPDLIAGDGFPDAFFFGSFIGGSNCTDFGGYHSSSFGTLLMLKARQRDGKQRHSAWHRRRAEEGQAFNATAFALGYASHMYADDVGFFRDSVLPPRGRDYTNWLSVWSYMTAIDAYFAETAELSTLAVPQLSSEGAAWVAEVAGEFRRDINPSLPELSTDQIGWCASAWQSAVRDKTEEALRMLPETWRHLLVEFTPYSATNPEEAIAEIERVQGCVSMAWQEYLRLIDSAEPPQPVEVATAMLEHIAELFSSGLCTPVQEQKQEQGPQRQRLRGGKMSRVERGLYNGGLLGQWPEVA